MFGGHSFGEPFFGGAPEQQPTGDVSIRCTLAGHSTFSCRFQKATFFGGGHFHGRHTRFFSDRIKPQPEPEPIVTDRKCSVRMDGHSSLRAKARGTATARFRSAGGSSLLGNLNGIAYAKMDRSIRTPRPSLSARAVAELRMRNTGPIACRCALRSSSNVSSRARSVEQPPDNILELLLS